MQVKADAVREAWGDEELCKTTSLAICTNITR